jgi:3-phenylpropionate/cinnamic acid dioxygenase small subunit
MNEGTMERTLKIAAARQAIEDIVFRCAEAVDDGDYDALAKVLHHCTLVMPNGNNMVGGAAIAAHYRSIVVHYNAAGQRVQFEPGASPRTKHVTTNLIYEFPDDVTRAKVRSYFSVYQNLGGQNVLIAGGRYLDRFSLGAAGWQIDEREVRIEQPTDMRAHLQPAIRST